MVQQHSSLLTTNTATDKRISPAVKLNIRQSKKHHAFYFCENLAKYYPISIIVCSRLVAHPRKFATNVCMFIYHTCLLC